MNASDAKEILLKYVMRICNIGEDITNTSRYQKLFHRQVAIYTEAFRNPCSKLTLLRPIVLSLCYLE